MSANDYLKKRDSLVTDICQKLNVGDEELENKVNAILDDNKKLKKENLSLLKSYNRYRILEIIRNKNLEDNYNIQVVHQEYFDGKVLKNILEDIKSSEKNLILTVIQKNKSKVEIYTLVTKDCFNLITAKKIINILNSIIGSTGGGRDDIAQAGLEYNDEIDDLIDVIKKNISEIILNKGK